MEKLVVEVAENVFNDIPGFPYRRKTLPEKIIRLRKMSQECHVRRMKTALQKKQMEAMQRTSNLSMSLSSSTSSVNRTISSPNSAIKYRNICNYFKADKSEDSSFKESDFDTNIQHCNVTQKDSHSRFTIVNRLKKSDNFSAANNSVMSDTALDVCCRKKSMIHPNCKINKVYNFVENDEKSDKTPNVDDGRKMYDKNEGEKDEIQTSSDTLLRSNTSFKGSWRPFDSITDSIHLNRLKMKKDKDYEEYLNISFENLHLKDTKNTEIETKGSNASKIPIFQSRLPSEKKNKAKNSLKITRIRKSNIKNSENIQLSSKLSNVNGSVENAPAKTQKRDNGTPKSSLNGCISKDFECSPEENSCNVSGFNSKSKEELISNTLHSVSKWLQESVAKAEKSKNSISQAESLAGDFRKSMESLNLKSSVSPKIKVIKTTSSLTYSVKDSCSGSDESLDDYYETETGDEVVKNIPNKSEEDLKAWKENSDDVSSELPAFIEDKIMSTPENYAKYKYSDAPDYPNTPYDLRYPRYYTRENDNVGKVEENSIQAKTPKKKKPKKIT